MIPEQVQAPDDELARHAYESEIEDIIEIANKLLKEVIVDGG